MLLEEILSALAFAFLIGLGCVSNYLTHHISVQVLDEKSEVFNADSFIASRAFNDLKVLNDFGPKATGSDANEILTVNFLLQRANQIKVAYENVSSIITDHQIVSGVQFTATHYRNVQNVVVKLQGASDGALLVNCHFDSEVGSYGIGDDGVNCCIMLEILRVLAKSGRTNEFSIIFLFNGSEEGNLEGILASHGFITQHKWAKNIKAFVNLEGQGIGGREFLFRSGPKHDWLVKKYRESVGTPFGQVFAEEMFETNVLSSGTDFESFRGSGNVPGLDISYCNQGWKYHTKFDHIRYMTLEPIQNTGNNMLALIKLLANSEELSDPPEGTKAVYFDLWGLIFISYSAQVGLITNIIVSVVAFAVPLLIQMYKAENKKIVIVVTFASFTTFIVGAVLSLAACFAMGLIINIVDRAMFWFNSTILSLGVYCALAVAIQIVVNHISCTIQNCCWQVSKLDDKYERRLAIQAQLNGINLFWALVTVAVSAFGFRFGYVMMVMLVISLITTLLVHLFEFALPKARLHSWVFIHFLGHTFSFLWTSYLLLTFLNVYIPITEKTFSSNPEIFISLYCCLMTIMTLSYFVPLASILKNRSILYTVVLSTFILCTILAFTPAGFPYSGSLAEPRVQRHYITHTRRSLYDDTGRIWFTDAGFFIKEHERHTKRTLNTFLDPEALIPKNQDAKCSTEAFCAFPSYNASNAFWLSADEGPTIETSTLMMTSRVTNGALTTMSFSLIGAFLTFVYIAPQPEVRITETSVRFIQTEWTEGKIAYHLKITNGKSSYDPFTFTITTSSNNSFESRIKVTIVTIDSHFERSTKTDEFLNLIDKFPDYAWVQAHQADVSSYLF